MDTTRRFAIRRILRLGSVIAGQDIGTVQQAVRILADELGLKIIKTLIETHVNKAESEQTCQSLFQSHVVPLLKTLSHPAIANSAVLEDHVTTILNYLVGPGGTRAEILFGFICDVLEGSFQPDSEITSAHGELEAALEAGVAVFSMILDSSTFNRLNELFPPIAQRFQAIITSQPAESAASHLQSRRFLDYIFQRLEISQAIPALSSQPAKKVDRAEFLLQQDLPGSLSRDGARHDNDHASIVDIKILPTAQEILSKRAEYWPTTDPRQSHVSGIQWVLDRNFRLLREDTIGQLRDGARDVIETLQKPPAAHRAPTAYHRVHTYYDPEFDCLKFDRRQGVKFVIRFHQPRGCPMGKLSRQEWWEASGRLQPSSLVCIVNGAGSSLFCTVAQPQPPLTKREREKKERERENGSGTDEEPIEMSLWEDSLWAYTALKPVEVDRDSLTWLMSWSRTLNRQRYALIEFPGILLPAFEPILSALKKMASSPKIPFTDLIVPQASQSTTLDVPPPQYAQKPGFRFNLKSLTRTGEDFWYNPQEIPQSNELSEKSTLDATQALALLNSLRRCIALTEGPPGTGKSYTGGALLRVLIDHKQEVGFGPIICLAYTNHALDQTLEHLHKAGAQRIIRIGSRSQSKILANVCLHNIAKEADRTDTEKSELGKSYGSMNSTVEEVERSLLASKGARTATSIGAFLRKYNARHHDALFAILDEDGFQEANTKAGRKLRRWLSRGATSGQERPLSELQQADLETMTQAERRALHEYWIERIRQSYLSSILRAQKSWQEAKATQDRVHQDINARCLAQADVVGVTTSGMANNLDLLRRVNAKIVVCEEAGEVLESHLLSAFLPTIEHFILIGDHLQLRPKISNYDLQGTHPRGMQYSLDVSLFERLVKPFKPGDASIPFTILHTQRRMHPSISQLIRSTVYPDLEDGGNTASHPEVVGMSERIFWLDHKNPETARDQQSGIESSYSNPFEVEMATALVTHLVRQGAYKTGRIAVLTPYKSQFHLLYKRLSSTFEVSLTELDKAELDLEEVDKGSNDTLSVAKTELSKSVRVATIDNFQGEEADVVVISLVRNNKDCKVGFLKTSNRINVLLSRARHGMYILGNSDTAASVPMWAQVIELLEAQGKLGNSFRLRCPRHPEDVMLVSAPHDFLKFAPDGGCPLRCITRLDCGHACTGYCHSYIVHRTVRCLEPCQRRKTGCDHDCPLVCSKPCEKECNVICDELSITLSCGHLVTSAPCYMAQKPESIECKTLVEKTVPECGHLVQVACHIDVSSDGFKCTSQCRAILPCGHSCDRKCTKCRTKDDDTLSVDHGHCTRVCGRDYTACRHSCQQPCHDGTDCPPCNAPCEIRCSHSRCAKLCSEPCAPCAESSCSSKCPHTACTMPCAAPCDWIPCSKRCTEVLACGHQCPSICGEFCPNYKYCHVCADEDIKATVVDMILMRTYDEIDPNDDPCIFPDCGHFFTVETLDGQMGIADHYTTSPQGMPDGIKTTSLPFSSQSIKACPNCRGSLRNIARYGRIVRRGLLDESTKKFILWSTSRYAHLGESFVLAQEELELDGDESWRSWRTSLESPLLLDGPREKQAMTLRRKLGTKYFTKLLRLRVEINKLLQQVKVEEQPFQRVADLVRFVQKRKATTGQFTFDQSVIQLKGFILTLSLLLRCDLFIISQVVKLYSRKWTGTALDLKVDFEEYKETAALLVKLASDSQRPYQEVEGHIYYAQACALERKMTLDTMHGMGSKMEAAEGLKEKGLGHISEANKIIGLFLSTATLDSEVQAVSDMLDRDIFYSAVSLEEKRAIFAAMAKEFSGTGHWYTCINGHAFTIGECGGAMEETQCPECGAAVGGQNHTLAQGVRRADEMENLVRGVAGL